MSENDRQKIPENLMAMSVEEVIDLIGDLTVRDAVAVIQRQKLAAKEDQPKQDGSETVS